MRKARSATPQPPMLPKEIPAGENFDQVTFLNHCRKINLPILADLQLEERVMRGSDVFVKEKTVSKINLSTVVLLMISHPNPHNMYKS